eukprot:TRINITY_DN440_c0_g2_i1.p1 TRINITY_DN440_c0_g2~~TRINITY_DN440_c0_g2_i1.p1  ORF type:complete len:570 (+),score=81.04 TRINITY_DN440_c0_g2_i1:617-2326(+)
MPSCCADVCVPAASSCSVSLQRSASATLSAPRYSLSCGTVYHAVQSIMRYSLSCGTVYHAVHSIMRYSLSCGTVYHAVQSIVTFFTAGLGSPSASSGSSQAESYLRTTPEDRMQLYITLPNGEEVPCEVTLETTYESFMKDVEEIVGEASAVTLHARDGTVDEASWPALSDGDRMHVTVGKTLHITHGDGRKEAFAVTADTTYESFMKHLQRENGGDEYYETIFCMTAAPRWRRLTRLLWKELKDGDELVVDIDYGMVEGRPYAAPGCRALSSQATELAPSTTLGDGWSSFVAEVPTGPVSDAATLEAAADAWLLSARDEHASVASFSKFSIQLMSVGAPADLVEGAHRAALQEVKHAQLCLRVASLIRAMREGGDQATGFGRFPPHTLEITGDLVEVAESTAREGAFGETVAALLAAVRLHLLARHGNSAVVAEIRAALEQITVDEAEHAALGWRTLQWANVPVDFSTIGCGRGADGGDLSSIGCVVDKASPLLAFSILRPEEKNALTAAVRREVVLPLAAQITDGGGGPVRVDLPADSMLRRYGGEEVAGTLRHLLAAVNGDLQRSG